jgi:hypothetical protein
MPSKYAVVSNDYSYVKLRNWDNEYYWIISGLGNQLEWRRIDKKYIEYIPTWERNHNIKWYDTLKEAEESKEESKR